MLLLLLEGENLEGEEKEVSIWKETDSCKWRACAKTTASEWNESKGDARVQIHLWRLGVVYSFCF